MSEELVETGALGELGPFAHTAIPPSMSQREVIVWYSDIRGFTKYCSALKSRSQDRSIQNLLTSYLQIYVSSVRTVFDSWTADQLLDAADEMKKFDLSKATAADRIRTYQNQAMIQEIRRLATPVAYKNLGDGLMVVWELDSAKSLFAKSSATDWIQAIILHAHELFRHQFSRLTPVERDSYADEAEELGLGSGVARGEVLRLDFPGTGMPDYAGYVMNLGARLCGLARPDGIVAEVGTTRSTFYNYFKTKRIGRILELKGLKGIEKDLVRVWVYGAKDLPSKNIRRSLTRRDIPELYEGSSPPQTPEAEAVAGAVTAVRQPTPISATRRPNGDSASPSGPPAH